MQSFLEIFDIYLLEAMVNGILLGGVLALLALGLNLIFGVIDVTWICYAELVMIGMYGMYYLVQVFGLPYWAAAPFAIMLVAALGAALHYFVIAPLLTAPPINQLLATGGALAGLAACLLVLQYDVHPFVGLSFGPITFLICVLGGLGNFVGGFMAAFVFAEIISLGGLFSDLEWGYVLAFAFFIVMMFIRPAGLFARRS